MKITTNDIISPQGLATKLDWSQFQAEQEAVVCYILQKNYVLLIHKKTGLGKGLINGVGGKLEANESYIDALQREIKEEVCIEINKILEVGTLHFIFSDNQTMLGKVYIAYEHYGKPQETTEARPFWVALNELPLDKMWEDDKYWLPHIFNGTYVEGYFVIDKNKNKLLSKKVILKDNTNTI